MHRVIPEDHYWRFVPMGTLERDSSQLLPDSANPSLSKPTPLLLEELYRTPKFRAMYRKVLSFAQEGVCGDHLLPPYPKRTVATAVTVVCLITVSPFP